MREESEGITGETGPQAGRMRTTFDAGAFRRLDMAVRAGAAIGDILDATDGPLLGPTGLGEGQVQVIRGAYERLVRRRLREDTAS